MSSWSIRRINRALSITGGGRYMEVGVEAGHTFFAVEATHKVAVDPSFAFDVAAMDGEGQEFHQVTSDAYFGGLDPRAEFDVVFLDGLHTFEQTYRDFCSALVHTHASSIILIDDVFPTDVFGSLTDFWLGVDQRRLHGIEESIPSWWGDVFKVVFMVHDCHPTLQFATIIDGDNGQMVVWRAARPPRAPHFRSVEDISRLSYFDFVKLVSLMNPDDESVFDRIAVDLAR